MPFQTWLNYICQKGKFTVPNSTESVALSWPLVHPPTTISWSSGRTADKHPLLGIIVWLMTSQELVIGWYIWTAVLGLSLAIDSFPPITSSRPWRFTAVERFTGRSAIFFHGLRPLMDRASLLTRRCPGDAEPVEERSDVNEHEYTEIVEWSSLSIPPSR